MTTALLASLPLLADARDWDHMGGWGWFWGTLMMLTWVAVIVAVVWLVTRGTRRDEPGPPRAREILDERYARGELSTDEYRERLDHLR